MSKPTTTFVKLVLLVALMAAFLVACAPAPTPTDATTATTPRHNGVVDIDCIERGLVHCLSLTGYL